MPNRKHLILAIALLISSLSLIAQKKKSLEDVDLTGLWKGFMFNDTTRLITVTRSPSAKAKENFTDSPIRILYSTIKNTTA